MAEAVTFEEVLNFKKTLLDELKEIIGATSEVTLADVNQNFESNILTLLRQIKEQGIGTGTGGTGLTTTQSNALSSLITAFNANKVLSDNNYSNSEKSMLLDSFQKTSNTSDDILEGITHLFLTSDERLNIQNSYKKTTDNTDVLIEGNMNLFVTPAEKAKWNGNKTVYPVPNITERDKLITNPPAGVTVQAGDKSFVLDDGDGKYAEYTYTGSAWLKTGDPDWANIVTEWANIASKPTTVAGYGITDAITTAGGQTIGGALTLSGLLTANTLKGSWGVINTDLIIGVGATSVTGCKINAYTNSNAQSMIKFSNLGTGQTVADGLDVGITSDGTAEIRQRENMPLKIYTNNALAATFGVDQSCTFAGDIKPNNINLYNPTSYLRFKDTQTTPQQWWVGQGDTANDGNFFIYNYNLTKKALLIAPTTNNVTLPALEGSGTRMVVATPTGQLSTIYKNIYFFPFADITTGWTDIHTIDFACFLSITFYNVASTTMQGVILAAVTPTGIVTISNTDNTGLGVTIQYNAGKIQLKTTSGTVSGSVNRLG